MSKPANRGEDPRRGTLVHGLALAFLALILAAGGMLVPACSAGHHGHESAGDDAAADDADDDAGDDTGHPCEGAYDVIVRGDYADDFAWVTTWTSKYVIDEDQTTVGIVIPDAAGWETYAANGVRTAPGVGYSDGSFPRPEDLAAACGATTVSIHVEYAITGGLFEGNATYYCPDLLGPYAIFGSVTCGTP